MGEIAYDANMFLKFEDGTEVQFGKLEFRTDKPKEAPRWFYAKVGLAFIRIGLMIALRGRKCANFEEAET